MEIDLFFQCQTQITSKHVRRCGMIHFDKTCGVMRTTSAQRKFADILCHDVLQGCRKHGLPEHTFAFVSKERGTNHSKCGWKTIAVWPNDTTALARKRTGESTANGDKERNGIPARTRFQVKRVTQREQGSESRPGRGAEWTRKGSHSPSSRNEVSVGNRKVLRGRAKVHLGQTSIVRRCGHNECAHSAAP